MKKKTENPAARGKNPETPNTPPNFVIFDISGPCPELFIFDEAP